jgi:superfamily II DNA or RNA helicase
VPSLAPRQSYDLLPHQLAAISAVTQLLGQHDRGQVRMACGTGKTLTAIRLAEELRAEHILVLVPNLSLLAQTLREWRKHTKRPFHAVAVCSDPGVADTNTAARAQIPVPVTTNPVQLAEELRGPRRRTVVFGTYHSTGAIAAAQAMGVPAFDLALADEAHRTAGLAAGPFQLILNADQIRATKRVFMTATARTAGGEGAKSMDDDSLYGPVMYNFGFGKAIRAGRLCDYRVVVVGITDEMIRGYLQPGAQVTIDGRDADARATAAAVAVLKTMADYDLRRMVTFHATVRGAADFATGLPRIARWMGPNHAEGLSAGHVNGRMTTTERSAELTALRNVGPGQRRVLTNAKCLTEGVDVPAIDGVAFIDPKSSYVDIIQAIGRALRRAPGKDVGTILLTAYVGNGEDADRVVASSRFTDIRAVLQVLLDEDPDFAGALAAARLHHTGPLTDPADSPVGAGAVGQLDAPLASPDGDGWDDPQDIERTETAAEARLAGRAHGDVVLVLPEAVSGQFHRALCTRLLSPAPGGFFEQLDRVATYVAEHGKLPTPKHAPKLYNWVTDQRRRWRQAEITGREQTALEAISGWDWDPTRRHRETRLRIAQLSEQGLNPADIAAQLNAEGCGAGSNGRPLTVGLVNKMTRPSGRPKVTLDELWDGKYQELLDWVTVNGPLAWRNSGTSKALLQWMTDQRTNYRLRRPRLTQQRVARLEAVRGWRWADPAATTDAYAA